MGKLDYDKKKGVNMEKEQADIDNDVYGSYEKDRKLQASLAKTYEKERAASVKRSGMQTLDALAWHKNSKSAQEKSEDIGERQRKMNSLRRQRSK